MRYPWHPQDPRLESNCQTEFKSRNDLQVLELRPTDTGMIPSPQNHSQTLNCSFFRLKEARVRSRFKTRS